MSAAAADAAPSLVVVGALADVVEDQFTRLFDEMGIEGVRFFPPRLAGGLPAVGPNTRFLLAQPFLADTARAFVRALPPGLRQALAGVDALAIGQPAAEVLMHLPWRSVRVSAKPTQASLMALL